MSSSEEDDMEVELVYRRRLQIFEATYKRKICIDSQEMREILAYGAENPLIINADRF